MEVAKLIRTRGFTYLELLITLVLLCILAGIANSSVRIFVANKSGDLALRSLSEFVVLARSEAATNAGIVTLCPTLTGSECGGNWSKGMLLFLDRNGDRKINQDDRVLRVKKRENPRGIILWRAFGNRQYLQVEATGFLRHQSGNFSYCDASNDPKLARQLVINSAGRQRWAVDRDGDGVREDSRGNPLQCH